MGIGKWITSPKFQVGQHDWAIGYYPQGNKDHNGKYVSIFLELIQTRSIDVTAEFGFELLDKYGNVSTTTLKLLYHTFTSKESNWGVWDFFERTKLEQSYIKDDYFILRVSIIVESASDIISTGFPCECLQKFRGENEHTDVTFNVDGKIFVAHRLILAAHSPVFKAELFGSMVESNMDSIIKINEMIPSVFKAMLDFMYNSTFSVNEKLLVDCEVPMSSTAFLQHLLVAADRYAIEKLKAICEWKLVERISLDTVLSTLEVAEMNNSSKLKNKCL
ncbi:BTB/POZ and MATH domain-containing protein 2-like [Carex rostrata]